MSETSPAAELRQAAALMRERASAASPGPWRMRKATRHSLGDRRWETVASDGWHVGPWVSDSTDVANFEHIAGMHPGVALPVARWLDFTAMCMEDGVAVLGDSKAVAVARAYLGTATAAGETR